MSREQKIADIRQKWGKRLLILAHHYQRDEIVAVSDLQGDSFQLSKLASENEDAEAILFCGVHFMAETADILVNNPAKLAKRDGKRIPVLIPDPTAGCGLADMADIDQLAALWQRLEKVGIAEEVTPVTYVNSAASLKDFCGTRGGAVCTSANAEKVVRWALDQKPRLLFAPDQYLGRNTANALGIDEQSILLLSHEDPPTDAQLAAAKVLLWPGYCPVHLNFLPEQLEAGRKKYPDAKIIVHPECPPEVVALADIAGSTSVIIREIEKSPPGSVWIAGTEQHLVERLAANFPDKTILLPEATEPPASELPFVCESMAQTRLPHVAQVLEQLDAGTPTNIITVPTDQVGGALLALERMLENS